MLRIKKSEPDRGLVTTCLWFSTKGVFNSSTYDPPICRLGLGRIAGQALKSSITIRSARRQFANRKPRPFGSGLMESLTL